MSPMLKSLREKRAKDRALSRLATAVKNAEPILRRFENQLASSLSCDVRSHDNDRNARNAILEVLSALENIGATCPQVVSGCGFRSTRKPDGQGLAAGETA